MEQSHLLELKENTFMNLVIVFNHRKQYGQTRKSSLRGSYRLKVDFGEVKERTYRTWKLPASVYNFFKGILCI